MGIDGRTTGKRKEIGIFFTVKVLLPWLQYCLRLCVEALYYFCAFECSFFTDCHGLEAR